MKTNLSHTHNNSLKHLHQRALYASASLLAFLITHQSALAQSATPIPDVTVNSPTVGNPPEGSEAAGYKPETVTNLGPLGPKPILDTPYSVNVISAPLIKNTLASTPDDLYRIDPVIQLRTTTGVSFSPNFNLRGFTFANGSGTAEDGMRLQNMFSPALEDKERVEVYTGLTSFLYGPTNVGGLLNYVYKRPTQTPLADVTVGDYTGVSGFVHGDFGGPLDKEGRFAYRLNIVGQDGNTAVDPQKIRRDLMTAALSWNITSEAVMTVIGSHRDQIVNGKDVSWNFPTNADGSSRILHFAAPNPSEIWGQPFTAYATQADRIGLDLNWKLNQIFTTRAAYIYNQTTIRDNIASNNNVTGASTYSQTVGYSGNLHHYANTGYGFIDADFDTWFVHHKLTTGFYGNDYRQTFNNASYKSSTYSNLNVLTGPVYYLEPPFPVTSGAGTPVRTSTYNNQKNVILGDDIKFNEHWSILVGANNTWLHGSNFSVATGSLTSTYDQAHLSPSASLIFKPVSFVSTYATYSESLQSGQVVQNAGSTIYTNNGQTLSPYVGREYEVGAKADFGRILVTGALFQVEQALQYAVYNNNNTYTYVQNGRQRNRGIELTAIGEVFEGLRIFGGVTLIDPRITQSQTSASAPSINGKQAPEVAGQMEKITAEYDLPFAKGLTLTGGFYFTGKRAVDTLNTEFLPGFTTEDLGFRYRTSELFGQRLPIGQEFVLRFDVHNITNNRYWLTTNYVGQPRTFAASAEMRF